MKRCSACAQDKPLDGFHRHQNTKDGHTNWCKVCLLASNKKWKRRNKKRVRESASEYFQRNKKRISEKVKERHRLAPTVRKYNHLRKTYGLTREEFEKMMSAQLGRCAICNKDTKLNVDHCHSSGAVRGLLCFACNSGIGMLQDSPEILIAAINYLKKHSHL